MVVVQRRTMNYKYVRSVFHRITNLAIVGSHLIMKEYIHSLRKIFQLMAYSDNTGD